MTEPSVVPLQPLISLPASERLSVRNAAQRDADLILDASADPEIPLISSVVANCSLDEAHDFLARQLARPAEGRGWSLMIVDRATDTAVGNLFVDGEALAHGGVSIGYWIGPSYRRQGYAAEALGMVRDWAPSELGVGRLQLYIDPENVASSRTAAKAGFDRESTYQRWERVGEEFRPMTVWGYGAGPSQPLEVARLERNMWLDGYRSDVRWFDHHLHDDFVEHGCSGKLWTRDEIVDTAIDPITVALPLADQTVRQLDETTWMLTYVAVQPTRTCRRVSVWQKTPAGWRMRFHQGTPMPGHPATQ